jgi:hypothetical protein
VSLWTLKSWKTTSDKSFQRPHTLPRLLHFWEPVSSPFCQRFFIHGLVPTRHEDQRNTFVRGLTSKKRGLDHIATLSTGCRVERRPNLCAVGFLVARFSAALVLVGTRQETRLLEEWCFRKNWPNTIANYRYWPKRLNRSDQAESVLCKINAAHVQDQIRDNPLQDTMSPISEEMLWEWSAIPQEDQDLWRQLPPEQWHEQAIGAFILATLKREHALYTNAYTFLVS